MTSANPDPGIAVVNELFKRAQIDKEWSVREERGFTWWPYMLAQRVWATSLADRMGVQMCQVHIETDLLKDVAEVDSTMATLSRVNSLATLSSCVLSEGRVRLHASVSVSQDNLITATNLATHALNLQLADSYHLLRVLSELVAAAPDVSVHPESGAREKPDDMLNVGRLYTNGDATIATRVGFEQLAESPDGCWLLGFGDANGFTAEMRMTRDAVPALLSEGSLETALFEARTIEHPRWGIGVATRLRLPFSVEAPHDIANQLNIMETVSPDAHQLGAWCLHDDALQFSSFFPTFVFSSTNADYAATVFLGLVWHQSARAAWANTALTPALGDGLQ